MDTLRVIPARPAAVLMEQNGHVNVKRTNEPIRPVPAKT
jgi:hypothetical protein